MNPALSSWHSFNPLLAILWAGLACGTLDISAALVVYGYFGRRPLRLLQGIAAGLLGSRAFDGGMATAVLGLFCHFFIISRVRAMRTQDRDPSCSSRTPVPAKSLGALSLGQLRR